MTKACQHLKPLIDYLERANGQEVRVVEPFGVIQWLGAYPIPINWDEALDQIALDPCVVPWVDHDPRSPEAGVRCLKDQHYLAAPLHL